MNGCPIKKTLNADNRSRTCVDSYRNCESFTGNRSEYRQRYISFLGSHLMAPIFFKSRVSIFSCITFIYNYSQNADFTNISKSE